MVIEAELQAALNTLTEYDFQNAFKKMTEALEMVYTSRKGLLQG
jgi:predicted helicase